MPYPPQLVNTAPGSTSYIRLWDYVFAPGMSYAAYDGKYNWAAAVVDYTAGPAVVRLICVGPYPTGRIPAMYTNATMTVTIVNPPNAPIPVPVDVSYYVDDT